jgi:hypothetical protein
MVPRPVLAVIMCFPITKEVDEAAQQGGRPRARSPSAKQQQRPQAAA